MKNLFTGVFIFLCSIGVAAQSLEGMPDQELSAVVGREGIALDFDMRLNATETAAPLSSLSSCAGLSNPCRLALKFANRNSGGGEWLVLKDLYGVMSIKNLFLDKENLSPTSTYNDPVRFQDKFGVCLIAGCNPNGLPSLTMSFPGSAAVFEPDISLFLNIGRVSVEYGASGFNSDANGSFLGLKISDVTPGQVQARADIDGKVRLYGF